MARKPRLYSYVLRYDDGAAPNPFHGICTLVICKPRIRLGAEVGDWIAGTGSAQSPLGDKRGWLIYAMKVTQKMSMAEYDVWARTACRGKLPAPDSSELALRCGDAIYDFTGKRVRQRWSVHGPGNQSNDLSGHYALLSEHFYYFGREPIKLPANLEPICHPTSGERWRPNKQLKDKFVEWLESLAKRRNAVLSLPARPPAERNNMDSDSCSSSCTSDKSPRMPCVRSKPHC
jgi:hypothetical protein